MTDIVNFGVAKAEKTQDSRNWTPEDCLQESLSRVQTGAAKPTAVMVLFLTDTDDDKSFDTEWAASNLYGRDMVFLLEFIKAEIINTMQGK